MSWHAELHIAYQHTGGDSLRTRALSRHMGPYRVLKALYPEGPQVCHHTLLHPPSGLVGGDTLKLTLDVGEGSHAVLTTPGASRFYRSTGARAEQWVAAQVGAGARLEWLPQENIVGNGALALNSQRFELRDGAQMMGWDLLALGLIESNAPFVRGCYSQHLELPGLWLERAKIDACDALLLNSPLGMGGYRAMATLWWASADRLGDEAARRAVDTARAVLSQGRQGLMAGVTQANPHVVVLRALGPHIEGLKTQLNAVRRAWRHSMWGLQGDDPRVWAT